MSAETTDLSNWEEIRPRPRNDYSGAYHLCRHGQACKISSCWFPHSDEERKAWTLDRNPSKLCCSFGFKISLA